MKYLSYRIKYGFYNLLQERHSAWKILDNGKDTKHASYLQTMMAYFKDLLAKKNLFISNY